SPAPETSRAEPFTALQAEIADV
ncbi:polymer-forming cytoskeletal protein, partial [Xanthomonas oryzae pv. oryzae]